MTLVNVVGAKNVRFIKDGAIEDVADPDDELPEGVLTELGADLVLYERHAKRVTFWMGGCSGCETLGGPVVETGTLAVLGRTRMQVRRQLSVHVEEEHGGKTRTYVEKRRFQP